MFAYILKRYAIKNNEKNFQTPFVIIQKFLILKYKNVLINFTLAYYRSVIIFYVRTSILVLAFIRTTFRPLYHPPFFCSLSSYSVILLEFQTEIFIQSTKIETNHPID